MLLCAVQGKAKLAKKSSKKTYQWDILREMGVPDDQLANFANPYHWLSYFVPLAVNDLKSFGLCADWRRSFITTHVNPFYDAFIRWQFNTLRKREKIEFGARSVNINTAHYTAYDNRGEAADQHAVGGDDEQERMIDQ